jgi:predicted nucleic acid-binding protein
VAQEIQRRGPKDPAVQALAQTPWLVIVDPGAAPAMVQGYRLGPGETEVLTWAVTHPGTAAVVDERVGRRCANALGIPCLGTVRLVIAARQQGIIPAARPVLEQLRQTGMYLSDRVLNQALAQVGE